ncbi:N-acylhomoserine lactone synthase [Pseudomonas fluorescens]|jgi:N-acyl-L-homoserine lactone synthetase|uniref:Acyl-homoserine-lactone synthase n=3 Tax=Pseudomonas TaxID=286 RepID=A0A1B3D7C9_PSEFL|nr:MULTISPECIES: acyl-homoserine-lactone synthase [Pseudomonas]AOE67381.1 N-acylhomoserine lactone synthase [Pseudomonas fluorescens]AOE73194.1 N-acylhomoserine lactone synthase [Pseudomonas fluorescens]KAA6170127.1 GNAT family N-acetyltransferase [Pseudomonas veronii]KAA6179884.1 GNAT family N-acetyltransferase [Pseudomonas veronii]MDR6581062.1 N-acyl-L-homoserine lactone synthetase [Pseudomonas extremaustralis]
MLTAITGTVGELLPGMARALANYRYEVFVKTLGWPLHCEEGIELDAFDRPDTVYVVACDRDREIFGCARLLPTNGPYLLGEVFPHLMGASSLPFSPGIWELSRFAISQPKGQVLTAAQAWKNTVTLVREVIDVARSKGAFRLIAFSAVGNERLLKRMGVNTRRISPPHLIDNQSVVPFWIEIDDQTTRALCLAA